MSCSSDVRASQKKKEKKSLLKQAGQMIRQQIGKQMDKLMTEQLKQKMVSSIAGTLTASVGGNPLLDPLSDVLNTQALMDAPGSDFFQLAWKQVSSKAGLIGSGMKRKLQGMYDPRIQSNFPYKNAALCLFKSLGYDLGDVSDESSFFSLNRLEKAAKKTTGKMLNDSAGFLIKDAELVTSFFSTARENDWCVYLNRILFAMMRLTKINNDLKIIMKYIMDIAEDIVDGIFKDIFLFKKTPEALIKELREFAETPEQQALISTCVDEFANAILSEGTLGANLGKYQFNPLISSIGILIPGNTQMNPPLTDIISGPVDGEVSVHPGGTLNLTFNPSMDINVSPGAATDPTGAPNSGPPVVFPDGTTQGRVIMFYSEHGDSSKVLSSVPITSLNMSLTVPNDAGSVFFYVSDDDYSDNTGNYSVDIQFIAPSGPTPTLDEFGNPRPEGDWAALLDYFNLCALSKTLLSIWNKYKQAVFDIRNILPPDKGQTAPLFSIRDILGPISEARACIQNLNNNTANTQCDFLGKTFNSLSHFAGLQRYAEAKEKMLSNALDSDLTDTIQNISDVADIVDAIFGPNGILSVDSIDSLDAAINQITRLTPVMMTGKANSGFLGKTILRARKDLNNMQKAKNALMFFEGGTILALLLTSGCKSIPKDEDYSKHTNSLLATAVKFMGKFKKAKDAKKSKASPPAASAPSVSDCTQDDKDTEDSGTNVLTEPATRPLIEYYDGSNNSISRTTAPPDEGIG